VIFKRCLFNLLQQNLYYYNFWYY